MHVHQENVSTVLRPGESERSLDSTVDRLGLLSSEGFIDSAVSDLEWEGLGRARLLSFDVFDTVLLRNDKSEIRRFWEMAQVSAPRVGVDARDLLVARLTSTRASYRTKPATNGYREGELGDIHCTAARLLGLSDEVAEELVALELEYEVANLTLNPAVSALVERLAPERVVVASNMYLTSSAITHLLTAHHAPTFDQVLSSTEAGATKNDTKLLAMLVDGSDIAPDEVVHVGDSYPSDFAPAKTLGWHALWWPIPATVRDARRQDAVSCLAELEQRGVLLGSLGLHFVAHP